MLGKLFKLKRTRIAPVAFGRGGCLCTDRIVVDGCPVGYMHREQPSRPEDSGWRFFAGDEDDVYLANTQRHGVYDVKIVVNYDSDIYPLLNSPVDSRLERVEYSFRYLAEDE